MASTWGLSWGGSAGAWLASWDRIFQPPQKGDVTITDYAVTGLSLKDAAVTVLSIEDARVTTLTVKDYTQ